MSMSQSGQSVNACEVTKTTCRLSKTKSKTLSICQKVLYEQKSRKVQKYLHVAVPKYSTSKIGKNLKKKNRV